MEINPSASAEEIALASPDAFVIQFWGVRGTLPVPGKKTIQYGGNTNCVTLRCGKEHFFIFDAGTGIKELSNYLIQKNLLPISAKLFLTHPHYDHINGIPFFVPFYRKGNHFDIYGTNHGSFNIKNLISNQMDSVYFPVTINEFSAQLNFHSIGEETFHFNSVEVSTISLNHPGGCMGYRILHHGRSFCFITDNEIYFENSPHYNAHEIDRLVAFIHGADLLVMDTTYSDEGYARKNDWGHSCVSRVVDVAEKAKVKALCLFHHDPDQYDEDITAKLNSAQTLLKERRSKMICLAPQEGDLIVV